MDYLVSRWSCNFATTKTTQIINWKRLFMCVNKYCFFSSIDRRKIFIFSYVVIPMIFLSLQFYHWLHSRQASNTWYCRNLIRIVNIVAIRKKVQRKLAYVRARSITFHSYFLLSCYSSKFNFVKNLQIAFLICTQVLNFKKLNIKYMD